MPFEIQTAPQSKRVPRKHPRKGSILPLDNRPLHIDKSQKTMNVYCPLSQCTTRQLKKKLTQILMEHWSLIHNQPLLKTIFTKPPIISYIRENLLKKSKNKRECAACTTVQLQLTTTISLPPAVYTRSNKIPPKWTCRRV